MRKTRRSLWFLGASMLVAGLAAFAILAVRAQDSYTNPDAGLSDSQRDAKHSDLRATSVAQSAQIIRDFVASGVDIATVRHVPSTASANGPSYDLGEARNAADLVVRGKVNAQRLEVDASNPNVTKVVSVVTVGELLKGSPSGATVEIEQPGTISLDPGGQFVLVIVEGDSVFEPGSEIVAFVKGEGTTGRFSALPWTVIAVGADGTMTPNDGNPKMSGLKGLSASELSGMLQP